MLVEHRQQSFEQMIETVVMKIQLTDALRDALELERGAATSSPFEMRNSARFRCNGKCIVTFAAESYQLPGQESISLAIVRDVSRTGLGIISHQQLFPEQVIEFVLANANLTNRV